MAETGRDVALNDRSFLAFASNADAIRSLGVVIALQAAHRQALGEIVLTTTPAFPTKDDLKHAKTIESLNTFNLLLIFWKESQFVDDADLAGLGMRKIFTDGINCNQLATTVARSPGDVARTIKRVETVVEAASAYGLIDRIKRPNSRIWSLEGTEKLHRFMLRFAALLAETGLSGDGGAA